MDIFFLTRWTLFSIIIVYVLGGYGWVRRESLHIARGVQEKERLALFWLVWLSLTNIEYRYQYLTIRPKHRSRFWGKLPCLKVGWRCRSPPATRKMASSANWTSNLETPSPWRPTARWWWCGTPRRTPRGGRRTWTWPRLRSLRTPTLPFCWHLCEMTKNTHTYPSSLHITESQPFKAKCQMPNHRSSLL